MQLDACAIAPDSWVRLPIKDVCSRVTSGGTPSRKKPEFYANGSIGWVKTKELADGFISRTEESITSEAVAASSAKLLPKDTILLAMYGATVGMLGILAKEMACNQACCALLVKPEFDRDFLFYQLLAHRKQLESLATGAAQQNLSGQQIKELVIPFPPLEQQKAIGSYLRILDDRITLLRETNTTLEAIAQALFKSWFVDFDPVHAKMQGRAPEGMDEATAALFPDSFEDSELGPVPKGWQVAKFEDFVQRLPVGKKFDQKTAKAAGVVPILDQGKSGVIGFHDEVPGVRSSLDEPVVVFANHTCYMRLITYDFSAIQNVLPFKGKGIDTVWAYYATKGRVKFSEYKGHWPDFTIEKAAVPSIYLGEAFRSVVDPLMRRVRLNEVQSDSLASLRDALLPRLISGQLRVKEAQEAVA